MIRLTDQELADFTTAIAWETGTRLPDGRILGNPDVRGFVASEEDYRIRALDERLGDERGHVLELGSGEGYHTVQLARRFEKVTAIEARPKNVICSLVNLYVHGVENVRLLKMDARELSPTLGRFDLVFHSGVLYHLSNPVEHLRRVVALSDRLLLDTHYASRGESTGRCEVVSRGKCYPAAIWGEGGWDDIFSGLEAESRWLERGALLDALADVGYRRVATLSEYEMPVGPRICLWAER